MYDNNSNLISKFDARSITTTFAYDALNRVTSKSYNDNPQTPRVDYYYDNATMPSGAPTFDRGLAIGRLIAVTYGSGSSAGTYRGYDAMRGVVRQYQQTDGANYLAEAAYYRNGSMSSQTYPSVPGAGDRRTVSYTNDSAGRLASLSSSATSFSPAASASGITYSAAGGLSSETYSNNLIHAVTYNSRLQPNEIKLGTSGAPTSVVSLTYNYGTTSNNGNLQSVSYAGGGLSYTQTFGYDQLNRLTTSQEGASWSQTNSYDPYGNRSIMGGALTFSASNNRITNAGYAYDVVGNLTNDTAHGYTFDAENKISKVDGVAAYVYDGEGQRVRKLVNENLRFIYGISGQAIAEFSGANGSLTKEYIYGASGLVATIEPTAVNANGTRYTTSDHLGSPRLVTNAAAGVASRHDYMPFGEELFNGGRTFGMGYGTTDGIRQKFTSKERDNETGLDYFGARYYGSTQGRFTSPDPLLSSGRPEMPESWNRYAYVLNNPLRFTDPDGLYEWGASLGGNASDDKVSEEIRKRRELFRATLAKDQANLATIEKTYGKDSNEYTNAVKGVSAYGTEHDGNKVFVGVVADNKQSDAGQTTTMDRKGNVYVTFQKSVFDKGLATAGGKPDTSLMEDLVAHEGLHVNQTKSRMRLGTWDSEYAGLSVQAVMATAVNPNGYRYFTLGTGATAKQVIYWNSSWAAADRPKERDRAVKQILQAPKSDGGYGLSPPAKKR